MRILEFEIPIMITPRSLYRINKLNLIILPTDIRSEKKEFYGPKTITKIILHDTDYQSAKSIITNFIIFINFLNQNHNSYLWLYERSFSDWSLHEREIRSLKSYIKENYKQQDWYLNADFNQYPLLEIITNPSKINFRYYFTKFHQLSSTVKPEAKLKELISLFTYNYLSSMIMRKIYDNANIYISNSFILLETLVKSEIKNQKSYKACPKCGAKIPDNKGIMLLIEDFFKKRTTDPVILNRVISILREHYLARNTFVHNAKFDTEFERLNKMTQKLGRTQFTIDDEIEHAGAVGTGKYIVNSIIRHELLKRLKALSSF